MKEFEVNGIVLDEIDKNLILKLQDGMDICSRPYLKISTELNITEEEVVARLSAMKVAGFIRKNAIATNHYLLGYTFNAMTVWNVNTDVLVDVGEKFKALGFVSHCYERPKILPHWNYNLFAMVHGRSEEEISEKVQKMKESISGNFLEMDLIYSTEILKKSGIRLKGQRNV